MHCIYFFSSLLSTITTLFTSTLKYFILNKHREKKREYKKKCNIHNNNEAATHHSHAFTHFNYSYLGLNANVAWRRENGISNADNTYSSSSGSQQLHDMKQHFLSHRNIPFGTWILAVVREWWMLVSYICFPHISVIFFLSLSELWILNSISCYNKTPLTFHADDICSSLHWMWMWRGGMSCVRTSNATTTWSHWRMSAQKVRQSQSLFCAICSSAATPTNQ